MAETKKSNPVDLFPYPTTEREPESPALTWIRNHSSYMTVGGFLNYLQVAGVYIRGILLNLDSIYAGSDRTGYVRIKILEEICPSLSLGTAMAISAGAASPNMGRYTNSLLVFLMTFANLRLGYWLPNPRHLISDLTSNDQPAGEGLLDLQAARKLELVRIQKRRENLASDLAASGQDVADVESSLAGFSCSDGSRHWKS